MGYGPAIVGIVICGVVYFWVTHDMTDHGWFKVIGGILVLAGILMLITDVGRLLFSR